MFSTTRFFSPRFCWRCCAGRSRHRLNRRLTLAGFAAAAVKRPRPTWRVMPWRHEFRSFPRRPETAGGRRRRVAARARGSLARSGLRPGHRQPRPRPARVRAGFHRVRRPHGGDLPDAAGPGPDQDQCRGVRARGEGVWRAAGGDRRVLGTGKRFRRQHGQSADAALAGVAGL